MIVSQVSVWQVTQSTSLYLWYQISVGMKTKNIPPYLWWYIYDEDILPARVYSPSLKSPNNVPEGCSSLQMEVYCNRGEYTQEELLARSVGKLVSLKIIKKEDILFTDVRFEPYANVIFDHNIYEARKIVRDYLSSIGIETLVDLENGGIYGVTKV